MNLSTVLRCSFATLSVVSAHDILFAKDNVDAMGDLIRDGYMTRNEALMESVDYGSAQVVSYLLFSGADPNFISNDNGEDETPLVKAIQHKNDEVARALLVGGAQPNLEGSMGMTPLAAACVYSPNVEIIQELLLAGADVNIKGSSGIAPLHFAAISDDVEGKVGVLLSAGADVDILDRENKTPLMYAAIGDRVQNAQTLLGHGASVSMTSNLGYNALDYAIEKSSKNVAYLLTELGIAPNQDWQKATEQVFNADIADGDEELEVVSW